MSKRKSGAQAEEILTTPLLQQILALLVIAAGAITLLAVFGVTSGHWANAWVGFLGHLVGWGVYPLGATIVLAGLLWLQYLLDRAIHWRWRPFVGAELVFFSLLGLTHVLLGRNDPWALVESNAGGGLVGWGLSILLSTYLGWPTTVLILAALLVLGLALAFDVTLDDARRSVQVLRSGVASYRARRARAQLRREPPAAEVVTAAPEERAPQARGREKKPSRSSSSSSRETARTVSQRKSPPRRRGSTLPPLNLLDESEGPPLTDQQIREKSRIITETLAHFGLPVQVVEVRMGPTVTQFGVEPGFVERSRSRERKVRVNQISQRSDDLALALATPRLRIEAPVPGRPFVGIEVPNEEVQVVSVREVMASEEFQRLDSPLAIGLGHNVAGQAVVADLTRMPHLLIAGTTGSGKSVCIKSIITCLIYNNTPDQLRLVMIDPKMVELVRFNGLPHLYGEVQVDLERVVKVLRWAALEMDDRYKRFANASARHLDDYNRKMAKQDRPASPRIVVLIDELADLMMLAPEAVEQLLCRIAQMGRATGIHLVVATQRPSTDVVTGLIKANFPARISFATASQVDSRVILDMQGAETLLGDGDMLYLASDSGYPVRVQGCYVSPEELDRVIGFWRKEVGPADERSPWKQMMPSEEPEEPEATQFNANYVDEEMLHRAISIVKKRGSASTSLLQRRLHIGYPRAARLMEVMTKMNIIGPPVAGGQRRDVLIGGENEDENGDASRDLP
ncbi:MAG: DNA translocase FtsK 4TM domain-containing protein [Anaerolineae bacterium]|jgi:S-DNA-T family DNA segregation ATPase FtsK/SpoIIIE